MMIPCPPGTRSVLDVGCGIRPRNLDAPIYVAIEPHRPYIDVARTKRPDGLFICDTVSEALPPMVDDTFDLALAVDVIEHLNRLVAERMVDELQRVARTVAIFTPYGPFPQEPDPGGPDQWGMDGSVWQRHRSAWTPDDFPSTEGWKTTVLEDFHHNDAFGNKLLEPISAFWAVCSRS